MLTAKLQSGSKIDTDGWRASSPASLPRPAPDEAGDHDADGPLGLLSQLSTAGVVREATKRAAWQPFTAP